MGVMLRLRGSEVVDGHWLLEVLSRLCRREPLSVHCYAVYYLTREPDRSEIMLLVQDESIESYALVWRGGKFTIQDIYEVYIWNPSREVVASIKVSPVKKADIQLYGGTPNAVEMVVEHFRELDFKRFGALEFHDMICSSESFKPSPLEKLAVKLGEEHAELYRDLELERGIEITVDEAREILKTYTHYGVIVGNVLASIAARYVALPWLHVIGGVFTRKPYRGRGYAKAVTSALTREAVSQGAIAGLHVEADNEPAIRVYTSLGYKVLRTRKWIFAHP